MIEHQYGLQFATKLYLQFCTCFPSLCTAEHCTVLASQAVLTHFARSSHRSVSMIIASYLSWYKLKTQCVLIVFKMMYIL
jgi:hypothetical protein